MNQGNTESGIMRYPGIRFPLVSSHFANGEVRTVAVAITPYGCGTVQCSTAPVESSFGAEHTASSHGAQLAKLGAALQQRKLGEQLVIRAREGDQNAMAIMTLVRRNAQKGQPRAVASLNFMNQFVQANPVNPNTSFGYEPSSCSPDMSSAVNIANGFPVTNSRVRRVLDTFGHENHCRIFIRGLKAWNPADDSTHMKMSETLDSKQRDILKLGRTIGYAKALQEVRKPHTPIAPFSAITAWELGE